MFNIESLVFLSITQQASSTALRMQKWHTNYKIAKEAQKLFEKFDQNMISLVLEKDKMLTQDNKKIAEYYQNQQNILNMVCDSSMQLQECFFQLLMAEFKNAIYEEYHSYGFDRISYVIILEYSEFLYTTGMIYNYVYNPNHFIFQMTDKQYHDTISINGVNKSILSLWQNGFPIGPM